MKMKCETDLVTSYSFQRYLVINLYTDQTLLKPHLNPTFGKWKTICFKARSMLNSNNTI